MTDSYWIIEPLDGLVVGDGKPFDNTPGARLSTRPFPPPSVTTGGIRSRHAAAKGMSFTDADIATLRNIKVAGPLLVELDHNTIDRSIKTLFAPAPADAIVYGDKDAIFVIRGFPQPVPNHIQTDLEDNLSVIMPTTPPIGYTKKAKEPPLWWRWQVFENWLKHPQSFQKASAYVGNCGPANDVRTHVSIDPNTYGSREGFLFQTTYLDFRCTDDEQHGYFALLVRTNSTSLEPTTAPLGGERRLMHWSKSNPDQGFPPIHADILTDIAQTGFCRVILLTPADWNEYQPKLTLDHWTHNGVTPTLHAVANTDPMVLSGWDFDTNQPKPTRRLAPAGTVLFLELKGNVQQRQAWAKDMWMRCVSDNEQANLDGFGLAVVGTWNQGKELPNGS